MGDIAKMFNPRTIALIGATDDAGSIGRALLENLLTLSGSHIFPVNPHKKSLFGIPAYEACALIPEKDRPRHHCDTRRNRPCNS